MENAMSTIEERQADVTPDEDGVMSALRTVVDPELGINIVDLGLIQSIHCDKKGVTVSLIMTTPACPLGEMIVEQAEQALVSRYPSAEQVDVELIRDILWSPDRLNDAGRRQLGLSA
jgi:metal-sulfur cluster biosynthetic enzyme